jgi:hypothetical protein
MPIRLTVFLLAIAVLAPPAAPSALADDRPVVVSFMRWAFT